VASDDDLTLDLPPGQDLAAPVRPGMVRVVLRLPDGTIYSERLAAPIRVRKHNITSTEAGQWIALRRLLRRKVGGDAFRRRFGKWLDDAVDRHADAHRRKPPRAATEAAKAKRSVEVDARTRAINEVLAAHPKLHDKPSKVAPLARKKTKISNRTVYRRLTGK
jgi:hypothetical protein